MADLIINFDNLEGDLVPIKAVDNKDGTYSFAASSADLWQQLSRNGQAFTTVTGFVSVAGTTETDFMLVINPVSSGVLVRLKEFIMTIGGSSTNTSLIRFYRSPTITANGSSLTINKVLASGTQTSQISIYQSPTISNRGTLIQLFSIDFKSFPRDQDLGRYLVEGANLLITVQGSQTNIEHNIVSVWAEESV